MYLPDTVRNNIAGEYSLAISGLIDAEELKAYMRGKGINVSDEHVHHLLKK